VVAGESVGPFDASFNAPPGVIVLARLDAAGRLDPTFGDGGRLVSDALSSVTSLLVLPDGQILVAGLNSRDPASAAAIVRYNADGTPDPSFGFTLTGLKIDVNPVAGMLTNDAAGNVVLVTSTADGSRLAPLRLGSDGKPTLRYQPLPAWPPFAGTIALGKVGPDGKLVVGGQFDVVNSSAADGSGVSTYYLARYNADGTIDKTFGTNGAGFEAAIGPLPFTRGGLFNLQ